MSYKTYAMDTYFHTSFGVYQFETQCEILAELGYDATYLSLWSEQAWRDLAKLNTVPSSHGLGMAGVYIVLDARDGVDGPAAKRILTMLETIEGCATVELAIQGGGRPGPNDMQGLSDVLAFLKKALEVAERRGLDILLYPHLTFWLDTHENAAAICRHLGHPRLGVVFCGFHWYARGFRQIDQTLEEIKPFVRQVNLAGSRLSREGWAGVATIEPLDEGELDNFVVLGALKRMGYDGLIGFQGWDVGGDVYEKLSRTMTAFRSMEDRVERHPSWARLYGR